MHDSAPVTFEVTEQTVSRSLVQARSGNRLLVVVQFNPSERTWGIDGLWPARKRPPVTPTAIR